MSRKGTFNKSDWNKQKLRESGPADVKVKRENGHIIPAGQVTEHPDSDNEKTGKKRLGGVKSHEKWCVQRDRRRKGGYNSEL